MSIYPRTEYEMSQEDFDAIINASKSTPAMFLSGGASMFGTPQENANAAWAALGREMGFDYMTVRSVPGKGERFFSAIPNETDEAKTERLEREAKDAKMREISRLTNEISALEIKLHALTKDGIP